ncbi:MAG: amino acid permease [Candidatus Marinimicrobia bacterium]|jgi:APA family basic amino acid/polyamine antiporter|nr:amino acid permease [Candidatus Neomarinimicrobiota bacterium]MBT3763313.1 amino acid permease [Candidatus Neomarinimicrobiota bacterium]MBT4069498.1 amino acid permease [Candidatus Neomarinimicrobiota bacterium]MBT4270327.1 amino acid permease [Candidatus Neomarinimicrobiota bacterium]MBT4372467.1 amino acid permease [Candidatus Neomarinimicrobiota bacterium]
MTGPKRVLKTFDATSMVTGNMIGSGIFLLAGYAAAPVPNDVTLILAWVGGGLMALLGAFAIAELSTRFPETGGDFLYLHKVFGPFPAFLYGWMSLVIFETGSIAVLALFSAKYTHQFFPASLALSEPMLASVIVLGFSGVHCLKVEVGSRFQSILTVVKILGIFLMVALLFGGDSAPSVALADGSSSNSFVGFSRALTPIFFAYTGWNVAGYMGGEIKNPRKTLPRALIGGTLLTTIIYVIVNLSFLKSVGLAGIQGQDMVPLVALKAIGAEGWTKFLSILIFVSVTSSLSITIQTAGARVIQSMGEQGVFFKFTAQTHKKFKTPVNAILLQAFWTIVLMFALNIESLLDSATVVMIMFSALSISTLLKVDRFNDGDEIYRIPLFPLVPAVYIISAVFISWGVIQFHLSQGSILPIWGLGFLIFGSIVYLIWKKWMWHE